MTGRRLLEFAERMLAGRRRSRDSRRAGTGRFPLILNAGEWLTIRQSHLTHHRVAVLRGVIVSLLAALSAVALPRVFSGSAEAQLVGGPQLIPVQWGAPQMQGALWLKRDMFLNGTPLGPGRNVATFWGEYNGQQFEVSLPSIPFVKNGHAEEFVLETLKAAGIPPSAVTGGYSDLEPCTLVTTDCAALIRSLPNLEEFYYWKPYPPYSPLFSPGTNARNSVIRELSVSQLKEQNMRLQRTWKQIQDTLNPGCEGGGGSATPSGLEGGALRARRVPRRSALAAAATDCAPGDGEGPEDGSLPEELGDPAEALDPGGIDFTSLQLRYLSLSGPHQDDLQYSMDSDGAPVTTNPGTGLQTAQEDSDAFFTWLTLPRSTFWVGLSPNNPPKIIDPRFGLTDAGRVLLQSDLLLKESLGTVENPATPAGAQFWQALLAVPPGNYFSGPCIQFKLTIRPGVATVHATKTQLYILNAPLKVTMENQPHNLPGTLLTPYCPLDAYHTTWEAALRQFILPELTQEVNTAPQWEPLRRVYMSRVAAQWVRQNARPGSVMGRLVDSGLHRQWIARPRWSPYAIWQEYLQQINVHTPYTVPVPQPNGTTVNETVYADGGVNFNYKIREKDTSNRQFKAHWHGLAAAARRSVKRPSTADGTTLVGGGIKLGTTTHRRKHLKLPRLVRIPSRFVPPKPSGQ